MNKVNLRYIAYFLFVLLFFSCDQGNNKQKIVKDNVSIELPNNWTEKVKENILFAYKLNTDENLEYFKFIKIDKVALNLTIDEILCESHLVWKNSKKVKYWGFDMNKISFHDSTHYAGYLQMQDKIKHEFVLLFCLFEHGGFIYRMELGTYKDNLKANQIIFQEIIESLRINGEETILIKEITGSHEKINIDSLCENLNNGLAM